jgi:hypothetical protein
MLLRFIIFAFISTSFVPLGVGQGSTPEPRTQYGSDRVSFEISACWSSQCPPDTLIPSLQSRLSLFVAAQAEGHWDTVASMLGRYSGAHYSSPAENVLLTPVRRACKISQMQKLPMLTLVVHGFAYSTEILSMPVSRRFWYVMGAGIVKTESGPVVRDLRMTAYRDGGLSRFPPRTRSRGASRSTLGCISPWA